MSDTQPNGKARPFSKNGVHGAADPSTSQQVLIQHSAPTLAAPSRQDSHSLGLPIPVHSLRRRWPQMICAGAICAVVLAFGTWNYFKPRYGTYASLRIHSETPRLAFEVNEGEQAAQFEIYKRTQRELVLSDEVLLAALGSPKMAKSPQVKALASTTDPVAWLRQGLRVDFPGDAEIMMIRLEGDSPAFLADAVNSVLDAYVENVINVGKQHRSDRLAELRKVLGIQEEKARRLRSKLESLIESLGSGDTDALSVKQQVAIQRFAQLQTELGKVRFDRQRAELELARWLDQSGAPIAADGNGRLAVPSGDAGTGAGALQPSASTALSPSATAPPATSQLELMVQQDPSVAAQQAIVMEAARQLADAKKKARFKSSGLVVRYELKVQQEQELLNELRESARMALSPIIAEQQASARNEQRLARAAELAKLKSEVQTLQLHEKMIAESLAEATRDADKIGTSSINVELTRKELERLEEINDRIGIEIETLTIELASGTRVEALGRAREPRASNKEDRVKKSLVFGMLGFLLPCAGLLWLDGKRRIINGEAEMQQLATLRPLGSVPIVSRRGFRKKNDQRSNLALREAVDRIRTVLIREAERSDYRIIQVTSAVAGEGKTTFACQLASSLARAHRRTVLVDLDLRRPSVHESFDALLEVGICDLLRGEQSVQGILRETDQAGLWRISAGRCDGPALDALTKDSTEAMLAELRNQFEFVIVDSSPVLAVVDSLLIAQWVDAVILTALRDVSRAPLLQEAEDRLRQIGANVVGSVITTAGSHWYYQNLYRYADLDGHQKGASRPTEAASAEAGR
jgi:capsular exopolysaccharide synthesis family protein